MKIVLKAAALYNIVWGAWVILFPSHFFLLANLAQPDYPMIWQGMGMVIGVYGLGYWWASIDPIRHWPIVAVGFLGKVFGPLGFIYHYLAGSVEASFALLLIGNDLIWWLPFGWILINAGKKGWPLSQSGYLRLYE